MYINNKSFALITPVLNEHQYINFFLDDYFNLGFHRAYILIDDSTGPQETYIIKTEHHPRVSLIFLSSLYSQQELHNHLQNSHHKSALVHEAIARVYLQHVREDYCMVVGVDSFLYLNGRTIQQLFAEKQIPEDVGMVFFQWFILVNNQTREAPYNVLNIIDNPNCPKLHSDHFFTLCQRKYVDRPSGDSHHYVIRHPVKSWFNDNIYTVQPNHNFWDITKGLLKINCTSVRPQPCIIHIMARCLNDIIIKYFHQWSKNPNAIEQKKSNLYNIIVYNSKDESHYDGKLKFILNKNHYYEYSHIASNYPEISVNFNELFIRRILETCGITWNQYLNWLQINNYAVFY